jgi:dihydropyrimidinase
VLIEAASIAAIAEPRFRRGGHASSTPPAAIVFPGFIDPHTHLDMPFGGTITADDFASGHGAAALGGTTTIVDFALHTKGDTLANALDVEERRPARPRSTTRFHLTIADGRDETLEEIPLMIEREGVNSFKCFMAYKHVLQVDDETIFRVMQGRASSAASCKCTPRTAT